MKKLFLLQVQAALHNSRLVLQKAEAGCHTARKSAAACLRRGVSFHRRLQGHASALKAEEPSSASQRCSFSFRQEADVSFTPGVSEAVLKGAV